MKYNEELKKKKILPFVGRHLCQLESEQSKYGQQGGAEESQSQTNKQTNKPEAE